MKRQPNIIRRYPRSCTRARRSACKTVGYVFESGPEDRRIKTAAHELGHGRFQLRHTFVPPLEIADTTDNLMSYHPTGTTLCKRQWDYLHDPQWRVFRFLQGEEEGRIDISTDFYVTSHNPSLNGLFLTPAGMPFYLEGVTKTFTLKEYDETTSSVYLGLNTEALYGFAIAGEKPEQTWIADIPNGWFTGYLLKEGPATHYQSSATQAHIGCQQPIQLWDIETLTFSAVEIQASDWFTPPSEWNLWQGEGPLKSSAMRPVIDNTQTLYTLVSEQNMHESSGNEMSEEEWNRTVDMLAAKLDDMISNSRYFDLPGEYTQVETECLKTFLSKQRPKGSSEVSEVYVICFKWNNNADQTTAARLAGEVALCSQKYTYSRKILLLLPYFESDENVVDCAGSSRKMRAVHCTAGVFGEVELPDNVSLTSVDLPDFVTQVVKKLQYVEKVSFPRYPKATLYVLFNTDGANLTVNQRIDLESNLYKALNVSDMSPFYNMKVVDILPCENKGSLDICIEIGTQEAIKSKYPSLQAGIEENQLGYTQACKEQNDCPPCVVFFYNNYLQDEQKSQPHLSCISYTVLHEAIHRIYEYQHDLNPGVNVQVMGEHDGVASLFVDGFDTEFQMLGYKTVEDLYNARFLRLFPDTHILIARLFYHKYRQVN